MRVVCVLVAGSMLVAGCGSVANPSRDAAAGETSDAAVDGPLDSAPTPDAAPVTVLLLPATDRDLQDANRDGVFDMVRPEDNTALIVRLIASDEFRIAFEFDLDTVPVERTITSAKLKLYRGSASSPSVMARLHGYSGNGVITLDDANINAPIGEVFTPAQIPSGGDIFDLTAFIAPLRASGARHAGILIRPETQGDLTSIPSKEGPNGTQPFLELIYN